MSHWLVEEMSEEAQRLCRLIDRVTVKGSEIPMGVYTFDINQTPRDISTFAPRFDSLGVQEPVDFGEHKWTSLRSGVKEVFFVDFKVAGKRILCRRLASAKALLKNKTVQQMMGRQSRSCHGKADFTALQTGKVSPDIKVMKLQMIIYVNRNRILTQTNPFTHHGRQGKEQTVSRGVKRYVLTSCPVEFIHELTGRNGSVLCHGCNPEQTVCLLHAGDSLYTHPDLL